MERRIESCLDFYHATSSQRFRRFKELTKIGARRDAVGVGNGRGHAVYSDRGVASRIALRGVGGRIVMAERFPREAAARRQAIAAWRGQRVCGWGWVTRIFTDLELRALVPSRIVLRERRSIRGVYRGGRVLLRCGGNLTPNPS